MPRLTTLTGVTLPTTGPGPVVTRLPAGSAFLAAGADNAAAGTSGATDGTGNAARFNSPRGIAIDPTNTYALIAGGLDNKIRKIVLATNVVTSLAGDTAGASGDVDDAGSVARLNIPYGIVINAAGTYAYFVDKGNFKIKRLTIASGAVETIAGTGASANTDGTGILAAFNSPNALCLSADGLILYITDAGTNNAIRRMVISTGVVTTIAGTGSAGAADGIGTAASFNNPLGIVCDSTGTYLYISDGTGNTIRRMTISSGQVTTIVGSGAAADTYGIGQGAAINGPRLLCLDPTGKILFIASGGGHTILKLNLSTMRLSHFSGSGAASYVNNTASPVATLAGYNHPLGIAMTSTGLTMYLTELTGNRVRRIV